MTKDDFTLFWKRNYPEAYPIGHELKKIYKNKWFRIHSLPNSKRYADTEDEYQIIFKRQNEIISDLINENETIILLFGLYTNDLTNNNYNKIEEFKTFQKAQIFDLNQIVPNDYELGSYLDIYIKETTWISDERNDILKLIADDEIRMMIISKENNRIISPYDGGVDLILESEKMKNQYKLKYKKWLP